MSEERRADPTWEAIRQNWPIILIVVAGISAWTKTSFEIQQMQNDIEALESRLSLKTLTDFARWQVGIERDIEEIKKK